MQKYTILAFWGILGAEFGGMGVILDADFIYDLHFCPNLMEMHHSNIQFFVNFGFEMHQFAKLMPKSHPTHQITTIYVFSAKLVHFLIHLAKSGIEMLKFGIKMHKIAEMLISLSNCTKLMPKSCSACRITPIYVFLQVDPYM